MFEIFFLVFFFVILGWTFYFSPDAMSTRELQKINELYEAHTNKTKTEAEIIGIILQTDWKYRGKEARELASLMNSFARLNK